MASPTKKRGGGGLFDSDEPSSRASNSLFAGDGGNDDDSPWSMPTPRKKQSRAEMVRSLLPSSDVPDSYIEAFDTIAAQSGGRTVNSDGVAKVFSAARLSDASTQSRIVSLVAPEADGAEVNLDRTEFNVLLALVGLAQEGEVISLDGVDERKRSKSSFTSHMQLPVPNPHAMTITSSVPPSDELVIGYLHRYLSLRWRPRFANGLEINRASAAQAVRPQRRTRDTARRRARREASTDAD